MDLEIGGHGLKWQAGQKAILLVSAMPDGTVQTALDIAAFKGPDGWGMILADVIRHVARAAAAFGNPEKESVTAIIHALLKAVEDPKDPILSGGLMPPDTVH